jgi:hypothetical protein
MDRVRRLDFARSLLLPLALTGWFGACSKWVEVAPPEFALEQQAAKTSPDRDKLRLHIVERDMRVEGFLAELKQDSTVLATEDGRVAISTPLIEQVDERRGDALGSIIVILGPVLLALAIAGSFEGDAF